MAEKATNKPKSNIETLAFLAKSAVNSLDLMFVPSSMIRSVRDAELKDKNEEMWSYFATSGIEIGRLIL